MKRYSTVCCSVGAILALLLVGCGLLGVTLAFASASLTNATGHGCAPPVPPTVAGSPLPAPATPGGVFLNEVLLNPVSTWNCSENGTSSLSMDSWVEFYNPQSQPLDLSAVHAYLDTGVNTSRYYLSPGSAIAAHGFLVIFPFASSLAVIASQMLPLRLIIADVTIDQVTVPLLSQDASFARMPDGGPTWQVTTTPTIDASNTSLQVTPTPTPTPMPTYTHTPTSHRGGSSGGGGSGTTSPVPSKILINGTQPGWQKLHFPPVAPTGLINTPSTTSSSSTTALSVSSGLDVLQRILLTVLVIALALAALWCWRAFRKA